jgi:hypothetical protein
MESQRRTVLYSAHEEANKHAKEKAASLMQEGIGTWRKSYISVQLVRVEICGEKFNTIICAKNADD